MLKNKKISLFALVTSLSNTVDLISPILVNHHKQVAIIAYNIAQEMGLSREKSEEVMLAGILHDLGALSLQERLTALNFELEDSQKHMETGYFLLKKFTHFADIAKFVRFHHLSWDEGKGSEYQGEEVPLESHILHLADRVAVLIKKDRVILNQVEGITKKIGERSGSWFIPELVDVFKSLANKEYFWLDAVSDTMVPTLMPEGVGDNIKIDLDDLLNLTKLFARIIDFRSPFTAHHSSGVAASSKALAYLAGFSREECKLMKVAGYLHDLGKLAIPVEILNKPGKLAKEEFNLIRCHTFYTYQALKPLKELTKVNHWASFHHEKLNGKGYPFHLKEEEIPLGSRIMAIADVFTAITEDRPYRKGMDNKKALKILKKMAKDEALDADLILLLEENFVEINTRRILAQNIPRTEYTEFNNLLID